MIYQIRPDYSYIHVRIEIASTIAAHKVKFCGRMSVITVRAISANDG